MSGHLENYSQLMYAPMEIEGNPYRIKPMNCPNHIMIFNSRVHSYRELPIRLAEFGTVYRFERSGVLHGLTRVRGFTQDDAHIFCRPDQIKEEVKSLLQLAARVHETFGFTDRQSFLSTRPDPFVGDPTLWDRAETALRESLEESGTPYEVDLGAAKLKYNKAPGEGAFYGPKIDVSIKDAIGRPWQISTIQLDFNLPRRFEVKFRTAEGGSDYAVMIHRALVGSLERFMGILIEHYGGAFPTWLAPVQVKVLSISENQAPYAGALVQRLAGAGIRAEKDVRPEKIGHKIREASLEKVPYLLVVGAREASDGTVSVRLRGNVEKRGIRFDGFLEVLRKEIQSRSQTLTV